MRLSTFCVLLASSLMLMGALIAGLIKTGLGQPEKAASASAAEIPETEEYMLTMNGRIVQAFGAEYSKELGQWTRNEQMTVAVEDKKRLAAACDDLIVEAIERRTDGACVKMQAGNAKISVWPVNGVRIFAGSRLKEGDVIAEAGGRLFVSVRVNGCAEDPERFVKLTGG